MKNVAIVQARMGSSRLPGKVLADLGGCTVLSRVVQRLRRAKLLDEIVIATSESAADLPIGIECQRIGVKFFRGSENDVLDRYYQTFRKHSADVIVRITCDCPLIDPEIVDQTIQAFHDAEADYASNVFPRTFPRGLDTEVFTATALEQAWLNATRAYQREHVTPYMYEHPELFRLESIRSLVDYSSYRWTLDTPEDMELISSIYSAFDNGGDFEWREVVTLMERRPELAKLNSGVLQKAVQAH